MVAIYEATAILLKATNAIKTDLVDTCFEESVFSSRSFGSSELLS